MRRGLRRVQPPLESPPVHGRLLLAQRVQEVSQGAQVRGTPQAQREELLRNNANIIQRNNILMWFLGAARHASTHTTKGSLNDASFVSFFFGPFQP